MREVIMRLTPGEFENAENAEILQELVRCKDCRYWGLTNFIIEPTGWCGRQEKPRKPDWFCADGERKGEEG